MMHVPHARLSRVKPKAINKPKGRNIYIQNVCSLHQSTRTTHTACWYFLKWRNLRDVYK